MILLSKRILWQIYRPGIEKKTRDGSSFQALKILLSVNPVNLDNCLNELPSCSLRYFKTSACIGDGTLQNKAKSK